MYRFAAAHPDEPFIFGAGRPGHADGQVEEWILFMQQRGIQGVCCLLPPEQLSGYTNLLTAYERAFGTNQLCWAPLEDFQVVDLNTLSQTILPFLKNATEQEQKLVVHCAGGIGRTGQVLAAWLVYGRKLSNRAAIAAVIKTGRNPYEAAIAAFLEGKNPWKTVEKFHRLLDACRLI
jgi:protein-tyrosine phosphatase